jgi:hypothetical protein
MFGYIVPDKPELKMKEYELFRGYYCGVCKSMGRSFGPLSRLALSYEAVFLGLLMAALNKEKPDLYKEACIANPFKKKWIVKNNPYVDFAADINVLLTYYKLIDNWQDERSMTSYMGKLLFTGGYRKARRKNPRADEIIGSSLEEQSKLEHGKCSSIDGAAEPTAVMIREILLLACEKHSDGVKRAMGWLGYNIGKWIYTIDAYDDMEKDSKTQSYNPLLLQYGYKGQPLSAFKDQVRPDMEKSLFYTLSQAAGAMELLDLNHKGIIENIIYLGMNSKTNNILCSQCGQHNGKGVYINEKSV